MTSNQILSLGLSAGLLAVSFSAHGGEAPRLQFRDIGAITEWRGDGPTTVYVKDKSNQWYKADMLEACMSENTTKGVQFLTARDFDTDKLVSRVVVDRHICLVTSIAKVAMPPPTAKGPPTPK